MDKIEQMIDEKIQNALFNYNKTSLSMPRHTHNNVDSLPLDPKYFLKYATLIAPNVIIVKTTGTSPVNVFPTGLPFNLNYTAMLSIALDTTAGNISLLNGANTVATIAKGTVSGAVVGAISYSNILQKQGTPATVVSSSAGNSLVIIFYTAQ